MSEGPKTTAHSRPVDQTRRTASVSGSSATRSARAPGATRPRSVRPRTRAGFAGRVADRAAGGTPSDATFCTRSPERERPSPRACRRRGGAMSSRTASVTSTASGRASSASCTTAGCTCTKSAMNDGTSRGSVERRAREPGRAVVQRAHAVEEMGDEPGARVGGRERAVVVDGRVPERDDDPAFGQHPRGRAGPDRLRARA